MSGTGRGAPRDQRNERPRDLPLPEVLEVQRQACRRAGSDLYARLLGAMADDVVAGGICQEILGPWSDDALADATPLRFLAAVHDLVLSGRAPDLARFFPSAGGEDRGDPLPAFLATVAEHRPEIEGVMHLGVQTNEVGRAAALFGAFHLVARRTGLPLRLLEVGASAGLLLRWQHYGYRAGEGTGHELRWGPQDRLVLTDPWVDRLPEVAPDLAVTDQRGCDVAPIDPTSEAGAARLRSYLWPDQTERRARLDAAIEIARQVPAVVDRADAGEWVAARLAETERGVATVVYHSIVLQYLPRGSFEAMRGALTETGAGATPETPLHWLRMEPAGEMADLRLRTWAGRSGDPTDEVLATTGYHGPPVTWLAGDATRTTR